MKGIYKVNIGTKRLKYEITLYRNISVIKGDSGKGKSELVRLVAEWLRWGRSTGIHCQSNARLGVFDIDTDWRKELKEKSGYIFFIDEYIKYVANPEFNSLYRQSNNYLVIISRSLNYLTYSVDCIYRMSTVKKGNVYVNSLVRRYINVDYALKPDLLITEDEKVGYKVLSQVFNGVESLSAKSKDKVDKLLRSLNLSNYKCIYIIVDGAAFGSCLARTLAAMKDNCYLYTPESFEYLVLNCKSYKRGIEDELSHTYNYCEYPEYVSWEEYYTDLLNEVFMKRKNTGYAKTTLSPYLTNKSVIEDIRKQLEDIEGFQDLL